jgi:hypothetical protein
MKKVIFKLLLLLLPFLVLYPLLEYKLSHIPNLYNKKREFLESQLNEIEILSTGSSHGDAINPDYIRRKTFTLNNAAQDLYYDVQLVNKYLDKMPKLKLVILPISYFSLEYQMDRTKTWTLAPFYYHFWGIPPQHWDSFINPRYFSLTAAYGWEKVLHYIENGFTDTDWEIMKTTGWWLQGNEELEDTPHESQMGLYSIQRQHIEIMHAEMIPANMKLLENIMAACQSRNIKVALVTTPVHHSYSDFMDRVKYQTMRDNLNYLVNRYQVVYRNYLNDPRFIDADFYSRDHVNTKGSIKFSKIIDEEIIEPALALTQ